MNKATTVQAAAVILSTPEQRARWEYDATTAEAAIRSARRQVQRYGDDAHAALMGLAQDDAERAIMARALSTSTRVKTVTFEWLARG